jgi:hypothetical protein
MQTFYLNNGGTRWYSAGKIQVTGEVNGKSYDKIRQPMFWEQLGNFAVCYVRVGRTVFCGFTNDNDGTIQLKLEKCRVVR